MLWSQNLFVRIPASITGTSQRWSSLEISKPMSRGTNRPNPRIFRWSRSSDCLSRSKVSPVIEKKIKRRTPEIQLSSERLFQANPGVPATTVYPLESWARQSWWRCQSLPGDSLPCLPGFPKRVLAQKQLLVTIDKIWNDRSRRDLLRNNKNRKEITNSCVPELLLAPQENQS